MSFAASTQEQENGHTSDTSNSLTTRQIGDMDKGVIERGKDVGNAKNKLAFTDLGTESHVFRSLLGSSTLRLHDDDDD